MDDAPTLEPKKLLKSKTPKGVPEKVQPARGKVSVFIDREKESERTDRPHLRELFQPNASIEDVRRLTAEPFALGPDDLPIIHAIGNNRRLSRHGTHGEGYDYSVESRILLSFLAQKMEEIGIHGKIIELFRKLIELEEKQYFTKYPNQWDIVDPQTGKTHEALRNDLFKNLKKTAQKYKQVSQLVNICNLVDTYFISIENIKGHETSMDLHTYFHGYLVLRSLVFYLEKTD